MEIEERSEMVMMSEIVVKDVTLSTGEMISLQKERDHMEDSVPSYRVYIEDAPVGSIFDERLDSLELLSEEEFKEIVNANLRTEDIAVRSAIWRTSKFLPEYWEKTLAQRLEGGAGSVFTTPNREVVWSWLESEGWEEYSHPSIKEGCRAFKKSLESAPFEGRLGVVHLGSLSPDRVVRLADRKGTGFLSAEIEVNNRPYTSMSMSSFLSGLCAEHVVIILGPAPQGTEAEGMEVVYTFHPGDPVRASEVEARTGSDSVTVDKAIEMGFETAKVVSKPIE